MIKKEIFQRELERQKKARALAEEILESKSLELYNTAEELKKVNKKLEDLLVEKNSQLQGVFENINDAYIAMDLEGPCIEHNTPHTQNELIQSRHWKYIATDLQVCPPSTLPARPNCKK